MAPERVTPDKVLYRTPEPQTTEGAPRMAARIILASLVVSEEGSPPRSEHRAEQNQAATRQLQSPAVPLLRRRWYRTAFP